MERHCDACGSGYTAKTNRSKFCADPDCKRARERERKRKKGGAEVVPFPQPTEPEGLAGPNEQITRSELEAADRLMTVAGQNAVWLARRLDQAAGDTGSSFAALAKQHLVAVEKALEDVAAADDPIDKRKKAMQERRLSIVR